LQYWKTFAAESEDFVPRTTALCSFSENAPATSFTTLTIVGIFLFVKSKFVCSPCFFFSLLGPCINYVLCASRAHRTTMTLLSLHRWSSGRILPCHGRDPGSIPGRCRKMNKLFKCFLECTFFMGHLCALNLILLCMRRRVVQGKHSMKGTPFLLFLH
jgi:hypothetical protein